MRHIKIFIELTRLNKPVGFMLLFWPCSWGLAYAYSIKQNLDLFVKYLILFFLGAILMRSAGCIFNDIVDKNYDKKVSRTKVRPIASGKISITQSLIYVGVLCFVAFVILLQFNFLTILLGMASMLLAFSYPFMKRITYWPQLFLGLTFNWGIMMAWTSMNNSISHEIILLYISAIFWTLGYDTIYGAQDLFEDEIIGLKSTAIKFKRNMKLFVTVVYSISIFFLLTFLNYTNNLGLNFFLILFISSLIFQIYIFDKNKPVTCFNAFKLNNYSGLFLFLALSLTQI